MNNINFIAVPSCNLTEGKLDSEHFCVSDGKAEECYLRPGFVWDGNNRKVIGEK